MLDRRRVFFYRPGAVFAFVRWAANTSASSSRIDIVRAITSRQALSNALPFVVRPGGEILLKIEGLAKVEQVLRHIDAMKSRRRRSY